MQSPLPQAPINRADRFFQEISQLTMSVIVKIPQEQEDKKVSKQFKLTMVFFMGSGQLFKTSILVFLDVKDLFMFVNVCSQFRLLAFDLKVLLRLSRRLDGFVSSDANEVKHWIRDRCIDRQKRKQLLVQSIREHTQELAQQKKKRTRLVRGHLFVVFLGGAIIWNIIVRWAKIINNDLL